MRQDDDNNKTKKPLIFCFHWEVVSSIADVCGIFDLSSRDEAVQGRFSTSPLFQVCAQKT